MKKLIVALATMVVCGLPVMAASNNLYTTLISTFAATNAGAGADISGTVMIKKITVVNTGQNAQTVTIYKNANSTSTITAICTFAVPATIGEFPVTLFDNHNSIYSSVADQISVSNPAFRTNASSTTQANINVEYWQ
jgi:hypothetical protein